MVVFRGEEEAAVEQADQVWPWLTPSNFSSEQEGEWPNTLTKKRFVLKLLDVTPWETSLFAQQPPLLPVS